MGGRGAIRSAVPGCDAARPGWREGERERRGWREGERERRGLRKVGGELGSENHGREGKMLARANRPRVPFPPSITCLIARTSYIFIPCSLSLAPTRVRPLATSPSVTLPPARLCRCYERLSPPKKPNPSTLYPPLTILNSRPSTLLIGLSDFLTACIRRPSALLPFSCNATLMSSRKSCQSECAVAAPLPFLPSLPSFPSTSFT